MFEVMLTPKKLNFDTKKLFGQIDKLILHIIVPTRPSKGKQLFNKIETVNKTELLNEYKLSYTGQTSHVEVFLNLRRVAPSIFRSINANSGL